MENNKEISIPVPNTRFIVIGKKQENNTWDVFLNDPRDNITKQMKYKAPNHLFRLFCQLMLNTEIQ